jgi:hypothetical protein
MAKGLSRVILKGDDPVGQRINGQSRLTPDTRFEGDVFPVADDRVNADVEFVGDLLMR